MKNVARILAIVAVLALVYGIPVAAQKNANVAGKWEMTWEGRNGTMTATLKFEQDGEKLKGTMSGQRGDTPLEGSVKGKEITFDVKRATGRGDFIITYKGTVDGDTMKGTTQMGPRTVEWTAKRMK